MVDTLTKSPSEPREYRLDVHFPRELSSKLELLKKEVFEKTRKRVSKAELVVHMVRLFFERA